MYYKVKDPISAVTNVDDYSGSARLLAATTLRNVLGTRNLGDILSERESIAQEMQVIDKFKFIVHLFCVDFKKINTKSIQYSNFILHMLF